MSQFLSQNNIEYKIEDLDLIWHRFDSDKDGRVSYVEVKILFTI